MGERPREVRCRKAFEVLRGQIGTENEVVGTRASTSTQHHASCSGNDSGRSRLMPGVLSLDVMRTGVLPTEARNIRGRTGLDGTGVEFSLEHIHQEFQESSG